MQWKKKPRIDLFYLCLSLQNTENRFLHENISEYMKFLTLGLNHRTAALDIRERVAFVPERMVDALQQARDTTGIGELVIVSTCNRTELYCASGASGHLDAKRLLQWLAQYHAVDLEQLTSCHYLYNNADAIRHMMRVACGLDSMVLGEPQILGQMKSAYAVAREANTVGSHLNPAFQQSFTVAKRVRTKTAIGENPVSVAYAAVSLARQIFADLNKEHALLIGAGETIELVARHLRDRNIGSLTVANRTLSRAQTLAEEFNADAILLADIPDYLHGADIVISSTASQLPILGKGAVETALKKRKHRPMFMVDIAVPRDIEPQVSKLEDVYLYTVDDLREVIDENVRSRENAAHKAEVIIDEGVAAWQRQLRSLGAVETIRAVRASTEVHRDIELKKSLRQLQRGDDPEQTLRALARNLTNKFLHAPTVKLKQASEEGRDEHLALAQDLFDLSE